MNPLCDWLLAAKGFHFAMLMVTVFYAVLCLGAFFLEEAPLAIQEQGAISSAIQEQGAMTGGPKEAGRRGRKLFADRLKRRRSSVSTQQGK